MVLLFDECGGIMFYYVCDGLLFESYSLAVDYANEQFRRFDIVLNVQRVVKV